MNPKIPPRSPAPVAISSTQPEIPARSVSSTNLNALDFITAPTDLDDKAVEHRIKKIQTKLEIENKYKIGSEKAIDVISMSGVPKNSTQYNEAQMRLKESNEKIECLKTAKQKYEKMYKGQPIEKDLTEYPVEIEEDSKAPQHHTLVKTLGRIRNAQNEGKLQMKFICIQNVNTELSAIIHVNGRTISHILMSKGFQWNNEIDIMATKDAEIEIVFQNDRKSIVGLVWFKSSDLEEALKLKYAESGNKNDNTFALQVEPIGELIIQLSYMRANGNYLTLRPGIQRRKAANKMLIYQFGHKLGKSTSSVLKCAMCGGFILSGSGLQCAECNYAVHQHCVATITSKCISQTNSEMEEKKNDPLTIFVSKYNIPHRFKLASNIITSWCSHCGQMLPTGKNCILKCSECNMICHHSCKIYIQNLCGLSMDMVKSFTAAIEKTEREKKRNQVAELQRHHKTLIRKPPPTLKKREVTINDFHFMVVLGRGNFGKVMLAEEKTSKRLYAIKVLKKQAIIEDDEVQSMMNEKSAFLAASQVNHPFLVNLHSCFSTTTRIYFVMEYCQCGDLISHIGKKGFNKARAKFYLSEVLLALEYLHSKDIIYRDLKLDNILLTVEGHIKLTDFGLCKGNMKWNATTKTFCGTPEFIAPEILIGSPYTRAVDWWTFGVLIYEMIVKEAPFSGEDDEEIFENIINTQPHYPSSMGKDAMTVCRGLLKKNPTQRLGYSAKDAQEIKAQAFFSDVDWQAMLEKRIPPPYVPTLKSKVDVSLFDEEFTKEPPVLTPVQCFLDPFEQELFDGFAYVNPYLVEN
ncbi:kinase-like protein [Piromyces finnis]|uniref:protein kinase C n=1 Tax=Piromyces finnis TaxID=1754191 RepID=A0A1Y1VFE0_9FUNG|nr:kinase-like protein [Piromyces finnis]|eukprot:ORX54823.1 kinase-like protein [Piromyces finnis]